MILGLCFFSNFMFYQMNYVVMDRKKKKREGGDEEIGAFFY